MNKSTKAVGVIASLAVSVSIFSGTVLADENELAISEQYFPNPCFRSLISEEVDTDGNGFLSDAEISSFRYLSINGEYDDFSGELTGIEYLYGLTHVQVYNVTGLTALDTQGLAGVYSVDCRNTPDLSSVNVNPAIHYITLENTSLTSFDVTGFPELTDLILTGNTISSIDISNNPELVFIDFSGTNITSIDISNNPRLITAYQYGYYDDDFSRSGYPSVAYVYNGDEVCIHLSPDTEIITSHDVSGIAVNEDNFPNPCFRALISEEVDTNGDGYISDAEIEAFTDLSINGDYDDFSGELTGIEYLYGLNYIRIYSVSGLTELNVQSLENVYSITCCDTPDLCSVSFGSSLHNLMLENTALSSIDVTGCPELAGLILSGNSISSIDISNNPELDFVDFSGTDITSVDISANPKLLTAYQEGYYDDSFSRSGYPSVSYTYGGDEICIYVSPDTEIITGEEDSVDTEPAAESYISTWVEVDGVRYYYDENGELATGLRNINGSIYLFNDNGAMMTGLVYYNGGLFYLGSDGVLQRALINFGGRWYFIY